MYPNHMTLQLSLVSSGRWMSNTYQLTAIQVNCPISFTSIPSLMKPVVNALYSLSKSSRPTQPFNFSKWRSNTLGTNPKSSKRIMALSSLISKRPNTFTHLTYFVRNLVLSTSWFVLEHQGIMERWSAVIEMTIDVSTSTWPSIPMTISSSRWKPIFTDPIDSLCRL